MSLQTIIEELLTATGASRATIRLDRPGEDFPVAAEALAPGIRSIAGDLSFGIRSSGTVGHLEREQQILVQPDIMGVEPAPSPELLERYGTRSQMLAPLVRNGSLFGIVSVHYNVGPREWTAAEVAVLEGAVERVHAELGTT